MDNAKPTVLVVGPIASRSGYGEHTRDITRSLLDMDKFNVKVLAVKWGGTPDNALKDADPRLEECIIREQIRQRPEVCIQVTIPNQFQQVGKYNIGITAGIETTTAPAEWLQQINQTMDLVIVPSSFVKGTFEQSVYQVNQQNGQQAGELRCQVPIEVLFEGLDTDVFYQTNDIPSTIDEKLKEIDSSFNFLFVGHWLQGNIGEDRKDVGGMLYTFFKAFEDYKTQPGIILKTSGATYSVLDRAQIENKINQVKNMFENPDKLPPVYLLHGDLTPEEMNGLYNHSRVKVHVSFTKGEGFGRPLLEASVSEKPMMVSNWSGHTDFLKSNLCVMLPGALSKVHDSAKQEKKWFPDGARWFTVNYEAAMQHMQHIRDNYKDYKMNAKRQAMVSKSYSLEKMTEKFEQILDVYLPEFEDVTKMPEFGEVELPGLDD